MKTPTPERDLREENELAAQLHEALARWAPSAEADCHLCRHLSRSGGMTCAAFPQGIPWEIQSGEFDHRRPHPDDHGIRYEPLAPEELRARATALRREGRASVRPRVHAGRDTAD